MGKFNWRPFHRPSIRQSLGDAHAEKENGKFATSQEDWDGGQGNGSTDIQKKGGEMQAGRGSSQVWEPWMQRYFQDVNQRKLLQLSRAATSIGNTDFLSVTDFICPKRG